MFQRELEVLASIHVPRIMNVPHGRHLHVGTLYGDGKVNKHALARVGHGKAEGGPGLAQGQTNDGMVMFSIDRTDSKTQCGYSFYMI